jgi:hypothetical protein
MGQINAPGDRDRVLAVSRSLPASTMNRHQGYRSAFSNEAAARAVEIKNQKYSLFILRDRYDGPNKARFRSEM